MHVWTWVCGGNTSMCRWCMCFILACCVTLFWKFYHPCLQCPLPYCTTNYVKEAKIYLIYIYTYTRVSFCGAQTCIRHPYLLLCTCSMRAGGMVWWSCRTRWHPGESRTPQTWRCRTLPACSSRWMLPGQRCKQSSPWWETLLQRIYPKGKNKKILII